MSRAIGKYIRISPFKVRRIANELRNKNVVEAEAYLEVMTNKGALAIKKVLHSARTNLLQLDKKIIPVKKRNINKSIVFIVTILNF